MNLPFKAKMSVLGHNFPLDRLSSKMCALGLIMSSIPSSDFIKKAACFVEEEEKLTLKYGQEVGQK